MNKRKRLAAFFRQLAEGTDLVLFDCNGCGEFRVATYDLGICPSCLRITAEALEENARLRVALAEVMRYDHAAVLMQGSKRFPCPCVAHENARKALEYPVTEN